MDFDSESMIYGLACTSDTQPSILRLVKEGTSIVAKFCLAVMGCVGSEV